MRRLSFDIRFVFHLLLLTVPFFFTWANEELFEFNKMLLVYGYTVIIGGLWLSEMVLAKKFIFKKTPLDLPILIFLISQLLSTLFSIHPRTSLLGYYTRFHGGLFSTISYLILLYAFVTHVSQKQLKHFLLTLSIAVVGVSLYGISEHFGHSPSCLLINSNFQSQLGGDLGWWQLFGVDCWVQDVKSRVFATFGQPNWLAAYVITLLPVMFTLTIITPYQSRLKKWWFGLTTLLMTIVLLFTQSRSGVVGLGAGMIVLATGFGWLFRKKSSQLVQFGLISLLVLLPIAYWGSPFTPGLNSLFKQEAAPTSAEVKLEPTNRLEDGGTDSGEIRKIVWTGAIDIWKRYPILGSGVETFAYSYYQDRPLEHNLVSEWDFLYNKAHNEFLNFLATTGIVGLIAYLTLLISFGVIGIKTFLDQQTKKPNQALLTLAFISGLLALSISNFFGFSTVMVAVLLFLYPAFILVQQQPKSIAEKQTIKDFSSDGTQWFGLGVVWLVVLYFLIAITSMWRADHFLYQAKQFAAQQLYLESVPLLEKAITLSPREALYYQELGTTYAHLAVILAINEDTQTAATVVDLAEKTSQQALTLNPAHLNFHKALARTYIILSQVSPTALPKAEQALTAAQERAPSDAKIKFNRALVALDLEKLDQAEKLMLEAIEMKPNYEAVYQRLAQIYIQQGRYDQARKQYQTILDTIAPNKTEVLEQIEQLNSSSATASAQEL